MHWHFDGVVRSIPDHFRHAGAFAPKEEDVVAVKGKIDVPYLRPCREQDEARARNESVAPGKERFEALVTFKVDVIEIIKSGSSEALVAEIEAGRQNDVDGDVEAGAEAEDGACILRNIGLVKGDSHSLGIVT